MDCMAKYAITVSRTQLAKLIPGSWMVPELNGGNIVFPNPKAESMALVVLSRSIRP